MKSLKPFSFRSPFARLQEKAHARGPAFTSLDAMKLWAIVSMTVDHIGFYFEPDQMWWRAVGRSFVPVWFFLAGYTRARSLIWTAWVYGALLVMDRLFVGRPLFALNVLVTIILCRLFLNVCEKYALIPTRIPELIAFCIMASFLTVWFFEYGSIAFLFALLGRLLYTKETRYVNHVAIIGYLSYVGWQLVSFDKFTWTQDIFVIVSIAYVVYWLARCPNQVIWPDWTTSWWKTGATLLSRNTLPYYFYHRLLFEILSAVLLGGGIGFSVKWFMK